MNLRYHVAPSQVRLDSLDPGDAFMEGTGDIAIVLARAQLEAMAQQLAADAQATVADGVFWMRLGDGSLWSAPGDQMVTPCVLDVRATLPAGTPTPEVA